MALTEQKRRYAAARLSGMGKKAAAMRQAAQRELLHRLHRAMKKILMFRRLWVGS